MENEKNEKKPKKFMIILVTIFATLVIVSIVLFAFVLVKNPLNVRGILLYKIGWVNEPVRIIPVENAIEIPGSNINSAVPGSVPVPKASALPMTAEQRQSVEDFGIDPDSIIITTAMEDCFTEKLGAERVNEIKSGDTPGALELIKASFCL